ncbi:MAG: hypothetical protein IKR19_08310 [Acholeplasmatales bacterium]|nr:hypothetical protein [Acholeplasmatales bacterium]
MKIYGSKTESDEINLVSINEDVIINFEGGTPAVVLEDESILVFESLASYNAFLLGACGFYNKETQQVDTDTLESAMTKEDDVDPDEYEYYDKPITSVALYDMDSDIIYRIFREDL